MDNIFLRQIQECLSLIEKSQDKNEIITLVAEIIFSRQDLLEENPGTIALINLIADWLDNIEVPAIKIYNALYTFWIDCITRSRIDIFYLGELTNLKTLAKQLNPAIIKNINYLASNETNIEYINNYISKIENCIAPFIIYDPDGMHFLTKITSNHPISKLNAYDILIHNAIPTSDILNSFTIQLANQYERLDKSNTKTVIIGNSYGIYSFPDNLIQNSVNLSMHSFGIKQAQKLVEHILVKYPHVDNFVFCMGLFDLYGDLLKSKHVFNKNIIDAFSQFLSHFHIENSSKSACNDLDIFSQMAIKKDNDLFVKPQEIDNILLRENIRNGILQLTTSTVSLEKEHQSFVSEQRASVHSKALNHQVSLDENKIRVCEILECLMNAGKISYWMTPPFPKEYTKNIVNEMKQTHREFFSQSCNEPSHFIDLSEQDIFQPEDFRDGDHLNFTGANKLINLLRQNNVLV